MGECPWPPVPWLVRGVDREADDVGEQAGLAVAIHACSASPSSTDSLGSTFPQLSCRARIASAEALSFSPGACVPKLTLFTSSSRQLSEP